MANVLGCQRGNEGRRALRVLRDQLNERSVLIDRAAAANPDAPVIQALRFPPVQLDEDSTRVFECRAGAVAVTGFDPGPVSNFRDDE